MQPQSASQNAGKVALRTGITFGILLGTIHSIITILNTLLGMGSQYYATSSTTLLFLTAPLIWIVGLLVAGIWGSKTTGKVSTGTLGGLFAGLFGGIVAGFGQAIALSINIHGYQSENLVLFTGFIVIFYVMILAIGAGAGLGALGGLIGQTISPQHSSIAPQPHPIPSVPVYQPPATPYGYMPQPQPLPPTAQPYHQEIVQEMRLPEQ